MYVYIHVLLWISALHLQQALFFLQPTYIEIFSNLFLYSDYAYPNKKEKTTYEGWGGCERI